MIKPQMISAKDEMEAEFVRARKKGLGESHKAI